VCCFLFQQGGPCELEVTGESGLVVVNGTRIIQGGKVPLRGGDEVVFGDEHAYVSLLSDFVSYMSISSSHPFSTYLGTNRYLMRDMRLLGSNWVN
jgi:hypothetical protein